MTQYGFHFDGTRCTGCKTCVLACKDKNNLPNDLNFRNVYEYGGGTWSQDGAGCWIQDTFTYHVSVACNHCDMPLCMANCPQGAIEKDPDTGEVRSDPELPLRRPQGGHGGHEVGEVQHVRRPRGRRQAAHLR